MVSALVSRSSNLGSSVGLEATALLYSHGASLHSKETAWPSCQGVGLVKIRRSRVRAPL